MKTIPPTLHILNQFVWPDWAPTGIYAEQLAEQMQEKGYRVRLVGGKGVYRGSSRSCPTVAPILLEHYRGNRENLWQGLKEYFAVCGAFARYIKTEVVEGDVVVVTSAPPLTMGLHKLVRKLGATGIYWLQDYYPELLKSVVPFSRLWGFPLKSYWQNQLRRWDHVVKIAPNLNYEGKNARVIRNWATLIFDADISFQPGTALYTGNLGYGHDAASFVALCDGLREKGYLVRVRGDGVGIKNLPGWIEIGPSFQNEAELVRACSEAEILLVAAHPRLTHALFPSKIWNFLASKRKIMASGFAGAMQTELETVMETDPYSGLFLWTEWLDNLMGRHS